MFIIRRAQMDALAAVAVEAFEKRLAAFLAASKPNLCAALGEGGLGRFVREGVARAKGYGIVSEQDVAAFVTLLLERGASFGLEGEHAWAGAIFARAGVPAPMRLEKVKERLAASAKVKGAASAKVKGATSAKGANDGKKDGGDAHRS